MFVVGTRFVALATAAVANELAVPAVDVVPAVAAAVVLLVEGALPCPEAAEITALLGCHYGQASMIDRLAAVALQPGTMTLDAAARHECHVDCAAHLGQLLVGVLLQEPLLNE